MFMMLLLIIHTHFLYSCISVQLPDIPVMTLKMRLTVTVKVMNTLLPLNQMMKCPVLVLLQIQKRYGDNWYPNSLCTKLNWLLQIMQIGISYKIMIMVPAVQLFIVIYKFCITIFIKVIFKLEFLYTLEQLWMLKKISVN